MATLGKKISQMTEQISYDKNAFVPIITNGENKKMKLALLESIGSSEIAIATPQTTEPDTNKVYIAFEEGMYNPFDGNEVAAGELVIFKYVDGGWTNIYDSVNSILKADIYTVPNVKFTYILYKEGTYNKFNLTIDANELAIVNHPSDRWEKVVSVKSGSGVTDYNALSNKPAIGGVTLEGDKTPENLGLQENLKGKTIIKINGQNVQLGGEVNIAGGEGGGSITIDAELNPQSTNAIQNKAVATKLSELDHLVETKNIALTQDSFLQRGVIRVELLLESTINRVVGNIKFNASLLIAVRYIKDGKTLDDGGWQHNEISFDSNKFPTADTVSIYVKKSDNGQIEPKSAFDNITESIITEYKKYTDLQKFDEFKNQTDEFKNQTDEKIEDIAYSPNIASNPQWGKASLGKDGVYREESGNEHASTRNFYKVKPNIPYTLSWKKDKTFAVYIYMYGTNKENTFVKNVPFYNVSTEVKFTPTDGCNYVRIQVYLSSNPNWESLILRELQLEKGDKTPYVDPSKKYLNPSYIRPESYEDIVNKSYLILSNSYTVRTTSHRGRYGKGIAQQNTLGAVIAAKKQGYTRVENDCMLTKDKKIVMWHDSSLGRISTVKDLKGYLLYFDSQSSPFWIKDTKVYTYDYSSAQYSPSVVSLDTLTKAVASELDVKQLDFNLVRRIDVSSINGVPAENIPTFKEWVQTAKELGLNIYIDFKILSSEMTDEIAKELTSTVLLLGMSDNATWLGHFDFIRKYIKNARLATLSNPSPSGVANLSKYKTDGEIVFYGDGKALTEEMVKTGVEGGYKVECWYVDYGKTPQEEVLQHIEYLVGIGVSGIALDAYRVEEVMMRKYKLL